MSEESLFEIDKKDLADAKINTILELLSQASASRKVEDKAKNLVLALRMIEKTLPILGVDTESEIEITEVNANA